MYRLLGCAVALTALHAVSSAEYEGSCSFTLGVDYDGNDISNTQASSGEKCNIPCLEDPRCTHYTYVSGRCFFKSSGDGMKVNDGAIGGVCEKTNHVSIATSSNKVFRCDLVGQQEIQSSTNLKTFKANNYQKCVQMCNKLEKCVAFTHVWSKCFLKKAGTASVSIFNQKAVSGNCQLVENEEEITIEGGGDSVDTNEKEEIVDDVGGDSTDTSTETGFSTEYCDYFFDVQYFGGNVEGTFSVTNSVEACEDLCLANSACKAFSFDPTIASSKKCYLKHSIIDGQTAAGVISADCRAKPVEQELVPLLVDPRTPSGTPEDSKWPSDPSVWEAGPRIPSKMGEVSAAVLGDHLFVFGSNPDTTFDYNIVTGRWSNGPARPNAGSHQVSFVVGTEVYIVGGFKEGSERMTQVYSPITNRWRLAPSYPGIGLGSHVGASVDGCLYVCSGLYFEADSLFDRSEVLNQNPNDCYRYDTYSQKWAQFANIPIGVNHGAAGTNGESMYIFGGRTSTYNLPANAIAAVQIYDIASNTWRFGPTSAEMPIAKSGCGNAPFVNGKFYIFGGEAADHVDAINGVFSDVSVFDSLTETWSTAAPLPTGVHGMYPVADMVRDQIFIVAGSTKKGDAFTDAVQIFKQDLEDVPEATVFLEKDHLVVMEAEKGLQVGNNVGNCLKGCWIVENTAKGTDGSTHRGAGYLKWSGKDFFRKAGIGVVEYDILISNPGRYVLSLNNFHDNPDSSEGNDVWVRMKGTRSVHGADWDKAFSSVVGTWNTYTAFHHKGQEPEFGAMEWQLEAGRHTFQISGRSLGFSIDRIHLHNYGSGAKNPNTPQSDMIAPEHIAYHVNTPPVDQTEDIVDFGDDWEDTEGIPTSWYTGINPGGTGCCRFADGTSGEEADYSLFQEAKTPPECEYLCTLWPSCVAYEVSSAEGCELHSVMPTSATTDTGCTCKKKTFVDPAAPPAVPTTAPEVASTAATTAAPPVVPTTKESTTIQKDGAVNATATAISPPAESQGGETVCLEVAMKQAMLLQCPKEGQVITKVKYVNYGRPSGTCNDYVEDEACPYFQEHVNIVESKCLGEAECALESSSKMFGKPCIGKKFLRVVVTCSEQVASTEVVTNCEPFGHYGAVMLGTKFKSAKKDVIEKYPNKEKTIAACAARCVDAVVKRGMDCQGITMNGKTGVCFLLGSAASSRQTKHSTYMSLMRKPGCFSSNGVPPPLAPAPAPAPAPASPDGTVSFEALSESGEGCCRFRESEDGSAPSGTFKHFARTKNQQKCESFCLKDDECTGYEVSKWNGCEVHTLAPVRVTGRVGCTCRRKVIVRKENLDALPEEIPPTIAAAVAATASNCLGWCSEHTDEWDKKCRWKKSCGGCSQCDPGYPTSPTFVPTVSPITANPTINEPVTAVQTPSPVPPATAPPILSPTTPPFDHVCGGALGNLCPSEKPICVNFECTAAPATVSTQAGTFTKVSHALIGDCVDNEEAAECLRWANMNRCSTGDYVSFMLTNCAMTCSGCTTTSTTSTTTTTTVATVTTTTPTTTTTTATSTTSTVTATTTTTTETEEFCKLHGYMWEERIYTSVARKNRMILERDSSGTATFESCMASCLTARMEGRICSGATYITTTKTCVLLKDRDVDMMKRNVYAKTVFWYPGCLEQNRLAHPELELAWLEQNRLPPPPGQELEPENRLPPPGQELEPENRLPPSGQELEPENRLPPPEPDTGPCKSWCAEHEEPWEAKCTWKLNCGGCSQCQ